MSSTRPTDSSNCPVFEVESARFVTWWLKARSRPAFPRWLYTNPHVVLTNANGEQHQQPIPVLAPADVQHAISLIQAAYAPSAATDLPQLQSLQSALLALLAMQRTPAAWGLVVPLLAHEDANVQFFGAHTASHGGIWRHFHRRND
ncbi:hypothetical protein DFH06DRAFT_1325968 [Mycena polygramma]|nr:hypothetical protein DFH06DRAFT_1325968 [Mycena polygramma]